MELQTRSKAVDLKIQHLDKSFGTKQVLTDLNLEATPGEFLAIVGKSGCGKSTLLRLVAGLEKPSGGTVALDDQPSHRVNQNTRLMFQDARLLPWKRVLDNVGIGLPKQARPKVEQALDQVGLLDRASEWPAVLSGGQKQRVALARALVSEPALLLLDEPLGALDALTRLEMQRLIENLWLMHGCTTLLITHDVEEAVALADRVLVLDQGQITLEVAVNLPRPRPRTSLEFINLKEQVLNAVLNTGGKSSPVTPVPTKPVLTEPELTLAAL